MSYNLVGATGTFSGVPAGSGIREITYSGLAGDLYGPVNMSTSMNASGYNGTPQFSSISQDGQTATWLVQSNIVGQNYSGPFYLKFTATIVSGASGWESTSGFGVTPAAFAIINSNQFVVDVAFTASKNGVNYSPFNSVAASITDGSPSNGGGLNFSSGFSSAVYSYTNDPPTISGDLSVSVAEGQSVVLTTSDLSATDPDNTDTQLVYTVTGSSNGVAVLNGTPLSTGQTFTQADLAAGLVSFQHDGSETTSGVLAVSLTDGINTPQSATVDVTVTPINDPPTLASVPSTVSFPVQSPAQRLAPSLTVTDPDNADLAGATVTVVSGGFSGDGDLLAANTSGTNITATYDSATETLTLSGADTVANYQSVLESVTFSGSSDPTSGGAHLGRTITWQATDTSGGVSTSATTSLAFTEVVSGGTTSGVVLYEGATQTVSSGGTASGTHVVSGSTQIVSSGGSAVDTTLSSGGQQFVSSGGSASGTVGSGGSFEVILPGGTVTGTTLTSGGYEYIYSGGTASGTQVDSGAIQNVVGSAAGTELSGFEIVFSGAVASGTDIASGGYQYILPGGSVSGTTVSSGGIQNVDGSATSTTLAGFQVIFDSSTASGTHITSTGYQYILPGGTAISTIVDNGGIQNVDGLASNTSLGGFQIIFAGATASGNVLTSGGYQYILPGGTTDGNVLSSGSLQNDDGAAYNTTISSGSEQVVFGGSIANNTTVMAGGFEIVVSGGVASNTTISGGFVELGGGNGVGSGGVITFVSGGTLQLDDAQHFTGIISGFTIPDVLDLRDIVYGSNTQLVFNEAPSHTSGTLTVTDGVHSANLTLLGQYITQFFSISSGGAGGTIVTDPPLNESNQSFLGSTVAVRNPQT